MQNSFKWQKSLKYFKLLNFYHLKIFKSICFCIISFSLGNFAIYFEKR